MKLLRNSTFWWGMLIVIAAAGLGAAVYLAWIELDQTLGPFPTQHWLTWTGTGIIAINVPLFYFLRVRIPSAYKGLLRLHVLGNLLGAALITVHFSTMLRWAFPADLETGVLLFTAVFISVLSGFILRFGLTRKGRGGWKFLHGAIALTFYLVVIMHILHGLGVL
ncbi:MAG: hypothetical protein IBX68_09765 [Dehalococcoidia bacterium]|nr:hypothetical protein [Dehalococcoidia bacterium]